MPKLWKLTKEKCYVCKTQMRVVTQTRSGALYGAGVYVLPDGKKDRGRVRWTETVLRCPKCGEKVFTGGGWGNCDSALLAAAIATMNELRRRLGYKSLVARNRTKPRRYAPSSEESNG